MGKNRVLNSGAYDNTAFIPSVVMLMLERDYRQGKLKTDEDFSNSFLKYFYALQEGHSSDYITLTDDWAYGIGDNCTGREDVAVQMGLVDTSDVSGEIGEDNTLASLTGKKRKQKEGTVSDSDTQERPAVLVMNLALESKIKSFEALANNKKYVDEVGRQKIANHLKSHKYVTMDEYKAPDRDPAYMTDERAKVFETLEGTFGVYNCCASMSELSVSSGGGSVVSKKGSRKSKSAELTGDVGICVLGLESGQRGHFLDFMLMLGDKESMLGKFRGRECDVIAYFEGEEMSELLSSDYGMLGSLAAKEYDRLDELLKKIAEEYGYEMHDRFRKEPEINREEFLQDMWNLYSLAVGKSSKFKSTQDYMVSMAGVSPFDSSQATFGLCYYNLCKAFRQATIERVEYYETASIRN